MVYGISLVVLQSWFFHDKTIRENTLESSQKCVEEVKRKRGKLPFLPLRKANVLFYRRTVAAFTPTSTHIYCTSI